jgi:hypothetical protein
VTCVPGLCFPITAGAFQTANNDFFGGSNAFVAKIAPLNGGASDLIFSTFIGGSDPNAVGDAGFAIAVSAGNQPYITGSASSFNFPTSPGAFQITNNDNNANLGNAETVFGTNAFVAGFNSTGTGLVYSTLLGGDDPNSTGDQGYGIALDSAGDAFVTGQAFSAAGPIASTHFPVTTGAFQTAPAMPISQAARHRRTSPSRWEHSRRPIRRPRAAMPLSPR